MSEGREVAEGLAREVRVVVAHGAHAVVTVDCVEWAGFAVSDGDTTVRLRVDMGGVALLRAASDVVAACIQAGARSGDLRLDAGGLVVPDGVGGHVRAWRTRLGLRASDMGVRLGISGGHVVKIEVGDRSATLGVLARVAAVARVSLAEFLNPGNYIRFDSGLMVREFPAGGAHE